MSTAPITEVLGPGNNATQMLQIHPPQRQDELVSEISPLLDSRVNVTTCDKIDFDWQFVSVNPPLGGNESTVNLTSCGGAYHARCVRGYIGASTLPPK